MCGLRAILHADSPAAAASMLFRSTFPTPAFMRWRYRDKARWPLPVLYPYRWMAQAGNVGALVGGDVRHRHPTLLLGAQGAVFWGSLGGGVG